ncbi:calcium/sodium antiporter [Natronospirillum operosum]|nr:calcium/sodium antiporter [Natronospirillum operosum]
MLIPMLAFGAGLVVLIWSADRFVAAAAALSLRLGVSSLAVGLTVVALGTSAPEVLVSGSAAWQGSLGVALGNAQGSNIANIGLVLGLVLILAAQPAMPGLAGRQSIALLLAMAALGVALYDLHLQRPEAGLLLFGLLVFLAGTAHQARRDRRLARELQQTAVGELTATGSPWRLSAVLVFTLVLLLAGAQLLVWGAVSTARQLGLNELVIGATIVALGTSLPELATAISSTLKRHHGMTLGNLLGSNVFNIFAVIGVAGMIGPGPLDAAVWQRDYVFLLLTGGLLLLLIAVYSRRRQPIPRIYALPLLALYGLYLLLNYRALIA